MILIMQKQIIENVVGVSFGILMSFSTKLPSEVTDFIGAKQDLVFGLIGRYCVCNFQCLLTEFRWNFLRQSKIKHCKIGVGLPNLKNSYSSRYDNRLPRHQHDTSFSVQITN